MIKNFVYLDLEKLRSVSSQVFEGVTERIVSTASESEMEQEQQKGPISSGRILADIFSKQQSSTEMRFLADYAFDILIQGLDDQRLLSRLDPQQGYESSKSIIQVTGQCCFNDMASTVKMLRDFNEFGLAMWRTQNDSMAPGDAITSEKEAKKQAGLIGLQLNEKVTAANAHVIEFGYGDTFEIFMEFENLQVSAPLRRECLRETENLLIQKYTRLPQRPITIVGLIAQSPTNKRSVSAPDVADAGSPRTAMRHLATHISNVETVYSGAGDHEIVIDPIAAYFEI